MNRTTKSILFFFVLIFFIIIFETNTKNCQTVLPVKYWNLSTGSRIAYISVLSKKVNPVVIIFLHGGPGASQVSSFNIGRKWYEHLSDLDFNIFIYDQIGSGLSARLKDPNEYSVQRHINDLECIRQITGNEKIILIGDSWGATLAVNYLAKYPNNVLKLILTSPGAMYLSDFNLKSSTPRLAPEFLNWIKEKYGLKKYLHFLKLDSLLQIDVKLAYKYSGDNEMDQLGMDFLNNTILKTAVYNEDELIKKEIKLKEIGWWVMTMTIWDATNKNKSPQKNLKKNKIPVLILRGDYDYLPINIAEEYSSTFSNSKFIRIPFSGHLIWLEQPKIYTEQIELFLTRKD